MARSKYNPGMHPRRAAELVKDGLTDKELAKAFGINKATLYRWQESHRDFCDSIKKAKKIPDDQVEAALFKRAIGYEVEWDEITASGEKKPDGSNKVLKAVRKKQIFPPSEVAMIFWLKNRRPQDWRDTYRLQHIFNREDGLEGIAPEDEAEVAARVDEILHGCPVCHPREKDP